MKNQDEQNFWCDHISKTTSKNDISPEAWDRICKIRNSPIILIDDVIIGESHKPHIVLPKGMKGYLIDFPEAFELSEDDLEIFELHRQTFEGRYSELEQIPACINGYDEIVFLNDYDYEITPLFFDRGLCSYGESHLKNN